MEPGTHTAGVNPTVLGCVGVSRPRRIVHLRQAISIHMCPLRFANRVVHDVFAAVEQHRPDRTPGAATPPELEAIRRDIAVPGWSMRIDSLKTTSLWPRSDASTPITGWRDGSAKPTHPVYRRRAERRLRRRTLTRRRPE